MAEGSDENHENPQSGYTLFATEIRTISLYKKGKQSHYRPGQALRVPGC